MTTAKEIIKTLSNVSVTLGWDVVVAYDRNKINTLLEQQYIEKVRDEENFSPVSGKRANVLFENLVLGPPLISFENTTLSDSRATATIDFISGSIIELDSDGQVKTYQKVEPGLGYSMVLDINLKAGKGNIEENGKVLIDFSESELAILNIIQEPPAEVMEFFRNWLLTQAVTYELGQLIMNDTQGLAPRHFRIFTQPAPNSTQRSAKNYGDGAVLLFIATDYNPLGGDLPRDSFPWLIPENHDSTLLISSRTLFSDIIGPVLKEKFPSIKFNVEYNKGNQRPASYLYAQSGGIDTQDNYHRKVNGSGFGWHSNGYTMVVDSLNNPRKTDLIASIEGCFMRPAGDHIEIGWDRNYRWEAFVGSFGTIGSVGGYSEYGYTRTIEFETLKSASKVSLSLDSKNEIISFSSVNPKYDIRSLDYNGPWWSTSASVADMAKDLEKRIPPVIEEKFNFEIPDINVFAANHLLFPNNNIVSLKSVHVPGDMVLFGDISPVLTSFSITPLKSTISVNDTIKFGKNTEKPVVWEIFPNDIGSIDHNGLYTAPPMLNRVSQTVVVTAKTTDGRVAMAVITIVPSSVAVTPSLIVIKEEEATPIQLKAHVVGSSAGSISWRISSDSEIYGSISSSGVYTPPRAGEMKNGYTLVVATASNLQGGEDSVLICLKSTETRMEFKVIPAFFAGLKTGESITLHASSTLDFEPELWNFYPEHGSLGEVSHNDNIYSVSYTAPTFISRPTLVFIQTTPRRKPHRVGYTIIEVTP